MSVLSDNQIRSRLLAQPDLISPCDMDLIQPASIDLHLESTLLRLDGSTVELSDLEAGYELTADEFILGSTVETVHIPSDLVAIIAGKSTLGRRGLAIEFAGYIDPGFYGTITLEIRSLCKTPPALKAGMKIAQIRLEELTSPVEHRYGDPKLQSHYQNQQGPTGAR